MVAVAFHSRDASAFPQRVNDAAGVLKHRVLVAGTAEDQVKRPAAANAGKIIGVAGHDAAQGEDVSVYDFGTLYLVASGTIAVGDYVNIGDTEGRVKTVSEGAGVVVYVVGIARSAGAAGQFVKVQWQPFRYTA